MQTFNLILTAFIAVLGVFHILTHKYVSPYTFTLIFGKKGSGKSLSMQKDLRKHYKRGWTCYADSNTDLPFVHKIDAKQLYRYDFPRRSLVCIDEINLLWDNRDFKSFDKKIGQFFRLQRKRGVKIIAYSQTFDCDKKLRDLADTLAIQRKVFRVFTFRRYYYKTPRILSAETTRDTARIADDYVAKPFFLGGFDLTYIPKYCKDYNTNETPDSVEESLGGEETPPCEAKDETPPRRASDQPKSKRLPKAITSGVKLHLFRKRLSALFARPSLTNNAERLTHFPLPTAHKGEAINSIPSTEQSTRMLGCVREDTSEASNSEC